MSDFGVVAEGFTAKPLATIKEEIETALKQIFGESIDLAPQSNFGQLVGVLSERYAELWDVAEMVYAAFTPDGATGSALDALCGITGTVRIPAASSVVTATLTGTTGTVVAEGKEVSVDTVGTKFSTIAEATIAAATAWVNTTGYVVGNRRKNGGNIYICITSGTSAGSGGPTTTSADITDGTAHWQYLGLGTGYVDVVAESNDTGPKVALSGTLTVIDTGVSGWSNVMNILDATLGRNEESDADLRTRREEELRAVGKASVESIREALLAVAGVESCTVFENTTDTTDGDSLPPHSIECLVLFDDTVTDEQDIFDTIWDNKAAGIATYGGESGTVTDASEIDHTINYSKPTEKTVYVEIDLIVSTAYSVDGDTLVKEAIAAFGAAVINGQDIVSSRIAAQAFGVAGVLDVTGCRISVAPTTDPTVETTIAIGTRQIARYDTSRITVATTPGVL